MKRKEVLFADANVGPGEADSVILGVRYEGTVSFRKGTSKAPQAIRQESWNFESYSWEHDVDLAGSKVFDSGDIGPFKSPEAMVREVEARARALIGDGGLASGKFLVALGGEHSISPPILKATGAKAVVVIDAHLDFRQEYKGSPNNHACASRRFADAVGAGNAHPIGIRSMCAEERAEAVEMGLRWATARDVRERGIDAILDKVLAAVGKQPLYLSVDIDGVDPAYAPGTGTPEPFGLTSWDAKRVVERLAPMLVGMDVVEVSPPCDNGNTASLAARLVREALAVRMKRPSAGR